MRPNPIPETEKKSENLLKIYVKYVNNTVETSYSLDFVRILFYFNDRKENILREFLKQTEISIQQKYTSSIWIHPSDENFPQIRILVSIISSYSFLPPLSRKDSNRSFWCKKKSTFSEGLENKFEATKYLLTRKFEEFFQKILRKYKKLENFFQLFIYLFSRMKNLKRRHLF